MEKINIAFELTEIEHDGYYIQEVDLLPVYGNIAKVKKTLKSRLSQRIKNGFNALDNTKREYIFCGDGSVLRVGYYHGSWGYEIACVGGKVITCMMEDSANSFKDCIKIAKKHAIDLDTE